MTRRKRNCRWVATVFVVAIAIVGPFRFNSSHVCRVCFCEQHVSARQVPLMNITYWSTRQQTETPLSAQLNRYAVMPAHEHDWSFATGGGNGITCMLGSDRHLLFTAHSKPFAAFIGNVAEYRGNAEAARWLKDLLTETSPQRARFVDAELQSGGFPGNGFTSKAEFIQWWESHRSELERGLDLGIELPE